MTLIGLVADIQFGTRSDSEGPDYLGALDRLRAALDGPLARADRIVQLGDLVDGNKSDREESRAHLGKALAYFDTAPVHHVVGNHCLRAGREAVLEAYGYESGYGATVIDGWKLVFLDTCERSHHGRDEGDPIAIEAREWLAAHEDEPRARPYGGAVSDAQLAWLQEELAGPEPCVVFGHHPLLPGAARENFLCWNGEEVMNVLAGGGARFYFAGHDHQGGAAQHEDVMHVTLPAILTGDHTALLELDGGEATLWPGSTGELPESPGPESLRP